MSAPVSTPAAPSNGQNGATKPPKVRNDRVKTPTLLQMEDV